MHPTATPLLPTLRLEGKTSGSVQIYNPADGSIRPQTLPAEMPMPPFSTLFLIESE
jgi:hypothetical protein